MQRDLNRTTKKNRKSTYSIWEIERTKTESV